MTIVYLPDRTIFPDGSGSSNEFVWLELTPMSINRVSLQNTVTISTTPVSNATIYRLLLPRDFSETMNHTWNPMSNTSMKVAEKSASLAQQVEQGNAVFRVDTPLMYDTSTNRNFTLMFNLIYVGGRQGSTPKQEVIDPIRNLQYWAAPQKNGDIFDITTPLELPYVFSIKTITGNGNLIDLFNINTAALTSIQPTYKHPFIGGYPTSAEVSLSFTDIQPFYKSSILNRNFTYGN